MQWLRNHCIPNCYWQESRSNWNENQNASMILILQSFIDKSSRFCNIYIYFKNMTVLLYTYFYIFLNVLRPTFFNIYNLPFLRSPNIGKIRVKVGPKTNYFSYILSSCTNRIAVFNIFFHRYVANQETNKTMPPIFFFPNIFWIIYF